MPFRPFRTAGSTAAALLLLPALTAHAQSTRHAEERPETAAASSDRRSNPWRVRPSATGTIEYDDNVFLLKESRKDDPGSSSAGEFQSGRYADMQSAQDAVASFEAAVRVRGSGLAGRDLDIIPAVAVERYMLNPARSNAVLGVALVQDLRHDGRLRARGSYAPSSFRRNYLAAVDDANGDGFIEAGERRYARGEAEGLDVGADYRHRLKKSRKRSPIEAFAQLGAGFTQRSYAAPFAGRDYAGPTADAQLLLDLTRRVGVDLGYGFAMLQATPASELLLVSDGTNRTATTAVVDRSRTQHVLGARARLELTRRSDLALGLERRQRRYTSTEATDVRYRGRRDARNSVDAELTSRLVSSVRTVLRVRYAQQGLTRGTATAGEEVDDYSRLRAAVGLRFTF